MWSECWRSVRWRHRTAPFAGSVPAKSHVPAWTYAGTGRGPPDPPAAPWALRRVPDPGSGHEGGLCSGISCTSRGPGLASRGPGLARPGDSAGSRDGGPHTGLTRDLARIEVEPLVSDLRLTPTWFTRPVPAPGGGGRRLAGPGLRRLGVGAGEPHEEGSDPPGERGRSVGARTANVGDGHAKQLGIGDRSGGTRGEARCDVGQRISSLGRAARWPTTGVREPQRSRLPPWTAWPGWVMRVLRPGDAGLHSARRPRAGYPWPR